MTYINVSWILNTKNNIGNKMKKNSKNQNQVSRLKMTDMVIKRNP